MKDYIDKEKRVKNSILILLSRKSKMLMEAQIKGLVQYRAGDVFPLDIPRGPIEVESAADSAGARRTREDDSLK